MVTMSAFEVLGPIMVGPSSSHTAGALRIALVARSLAPQPLASVDFTLYNSFSRTHRGHGTDLALVAGILGLAPDDPHVRDSFHLAHDAGLDFSLTEGGEDDRLHPNTVAILMRSAQGEDVRVTGESLGGGRVRISSIDGVPVQVTGELPTVFVAHADKPGVLAALTRELSDRQVNIATMRTFRSEPGGAAYTVFEVDEPVGGELLARLRRVGHVGFVAMVDVPGASAPTPSREEGVSFSTGADLLRLCEGRKVTIGQLMREREAALRPSADASADPDAQMARVLATMRDEVTDTLTHPRRSLGGYLDGQAADVGASAASLAAPLMGETLTRAVAYAMAVLERSATMGVIVAAPTAGSAGVVPGAVLAVGGSVDAGDKALQLALWNAAAIGAILSTNASVAGAEGGCQAEVGSAAAMAASALVELLGGTPAQCLDAAGLAITNLLGLVCDPVRGMVEVPCQARNAIGVSDAVSAAQLALSGVRSPIPFDEVVGAMAEVGHALPASLRETARGGLAARPSACASCAGFGL